MKVVLAKPLPRCWKNHRQARGILLESDVAPAPNTRLRAKLMVFDTRANMRHFWNRVMANSRLGFGCSGAVNGLACEKINFYGNGKESKPVMEVDPRYFCVIALCVLDLCFEVVCHEATHAGFCYAKRTQTRNMWAKKFDFDEEHICYPAGRIASAINRLLFRNNLYARSRRVAKA